MSDTLSKITCSITGLSVEAKPAKDGRGSTTSRLAEGWRSYA